MNTLSQRLTQASLAALLAAALPAHALVPDGLPPTGAGPLPVGTHGDAHLEERVNSLASELRCLVCQNQTVAESTAPLARQLKAEVRTQLAGGATEQQVRDFMAQRYGDFVLYRPPVTQLTWLLWGGPLALLGLGALLIAQRRTRPGTEPKGAATDHNDAPDSNW
ncbi:MAG: cytochrome c-type biogenesis protein [Pseudomonadota bacterium]